MISISRRAIFLTIVVIAPEKMSFNAFMAAGGNSTSRSDRIPQTNSSRSDTARSDTARSITGSNDLFGDATGRKNGSEAMESSRTTMSTARVHTALAALAAEKQSLMSKLALIDGELEVKKVKLNKSYGKK